jgi:hypothetical protein
MVPLLDVPEPWRALVWEINGNRPFDGTPGIRDVDAPCDAFEPAGEPFEQAKGEGSCDTDGHYICSECVHISLRVLRARRDQCEDCGAPLVRERNVGEVCSARCDRPAVVAAADGGAP